MIKSFENSRNLHPHGVLGCRKGRIIFPFRRRFRLKVPTGQATRPQSGASMARAAACEQLAPHTTFSRTCWKVQCFGFQRIWRILANKWDLDIDLSRIVDDTIHRLWQDILDHKILQCKCVRFCPIGIASSKDWTSKTLVRASNLSMCVNFSSASCPTGNTCQFPRFFLVSEPPHLVKSVCSSACPRCCRKSCNNAWLLVNEKAFKRKKI